MKIIIEDIQPDGVLITFPEGFYFDNYREAVDFAEMVRDWQNKTIEKNHKELLEAADEIAKQMQEQNFAETGIFKFREKPKIKNIEVATVDLKTPKKKLKVFEKITKVKTPDKLLIPMIKRGRPKKQPEPEGHLPYEEILLGKTPYEFIKELADKGMDKNAIIRPEYLSRVKEWCEKNDHKYNNRMKAKVKIVFESNYRKINKKDG